MNTDVTTDAKPAFKKFRERSGQRQRYGSVSELRVTHKDKGSVKVVVSLQDVLIVFVRFAVKFFVELCEGILARVRQLQHWTLVFLRARIVTVDHLSISHGVADECNENVPSWGGCSGGYDILFRHGGLL